jgi:hypothetical protein
MARHKPGEYAELHWGGHPADFEMVYGYVGQETFDEVVRQGREAIGGDASHIPTLGPYDYKVEVTVKPKGRESDGEL